MIDSTPEDLLPDPISDEAAHVLSVFLNQLVFACEEKYHAQIRRYLYDHADDDTNSPGHNETLHFTYKNNTEEPPF